MASAGNPVVRAIAVAATLAAAGCSGEPQTAATFEDESTGAFLEIVTSQRVPDSWGGEEYVYARLRRGDEVSPLLEIDINGRFGDRLRADFSPGARWARISVELDPPHVGEQTWLDDGGSGAFVFQPWDQGRARVRKEYRHFVVAYVDFDAKRVVRPTLLQSTKAERRTLFPLFEELPQAQEFRGERLEWHVGKKADPPTEPR